MDPGGVVGLRYRQSPQTQHEDSPRSTVSSGCQLGGLRRRGGGGTDGVVGETSYVDCFLWLQRWRLAGAAR